MNLYPKKRRPRETGPIHVSWRYSKGPSHHFPELCFTSNRIQSVKVNQVKWKFFEISWYIKFILIIIKFRIAYLIQNQLSSLIRMEGDVGERKLDKGLEINSQSKIYIDKKWPSARFFVIDVINLSQPCAHWSNQAPLKNFLGRQSDA